MPIKGMTDHAPMFPTIGTLRKGAKKTNESKPGTDLTYLRFDSEDPLAVRMFAEAYPDQEALRNIHVFLPNRTADENMESWVEEWVAGGLVHRCDGETKVLWRTPAGGYSTEKVPCKNCKGKQVGRLSVIVPELGRLACITVLTTSIHDIIKLTAQLRAYEALRGDLRGIPFILRRRKEKVSTPGPDGKRLRREKWLLSIETQPEWTMLQLTAMQRAALPAGEPIEDVDEGHYEDLPQGMSDPFGEEEIDQDTGEVLPPSQPEEVQPEQHWSEGEANRAKMVTTLEKYDFPLEALFKGNGATDWDGLKTVTTGKEAIAKARQWWEANRPDLYEVAELSPELQAALAGAAEF